MRARHSPFPPYWWATALSDAGVESRPRVGTYGKYEYADLPPVPFPMSGDLAWLEAQPVHDEWTINGNADDRLPELLAACDRAGLELPPAFTRFMESPPLQERVRSCTGCYIDLDAAPVKAPSGGHLVRFLADQQGCLFWYLHLTEGGADHAVVCSPDFHGTEADEAPAGPDEISFAAETFETFICRFWLENEIWYAAAEGAHSEVGLEYVQRYRNGGNAR
ncbi:hypothetical protein L0U85_12020 [Glycomyces sp. L485]|uniref:hypothetical protein n=1 Tax=Glycomyces sp. L485 TaxID=2909235 RepID=UPI001F4A589D|nr:hypothetical protein [Glycomyces sp. L485]MCH7231571.1 hypothetical protein [Glycomyces sp. L485]